MFAVPKCELLLYLILNHHIKIGDENPKCCSYILYCLLKTSYINYNYSLCDRKMDPEN